MRPYRRSPGFNFVLAHASCNSNKSDRLACTDHLNAWVEPTAQVGAAMAKEFDRSGIVHDVPTSTRIVNWVYAQAFNCGGLTWVRSDELTQLTPDWAQGLSRLLN